MSVPAPTLPVGLCEHSCWQLCRELTWEFKSADAVTLPSSKEDLFLTVAFLLSQTLAGLEHLWKQNSSRGNVKPGTGIMWFWQSLFSNSQRFRAGFYHWQSRFSATGSWWLSLRVDGILTWCNNIVSLYILLYIITHLMVITCILKLSVSGSSDQVKGNWGK